MPTTTIVDWEKNAVLEACLLHILDDFAVICRWRILNMDSPLSLEMMVLHTKLIVTLNEEHGRRPNTRTLVDLWELTGWITYPHEPKYARFQQRAEALRAQHNQK